MLMLFLAAAMALALDSMELHGAKFFRISTFLPYAVPAVVSTLIWGFMYGAKYGLVGSLNDWLGTNLDVLSPNVLLAAIGNIVTWEFTGYNMLIFYSSLSTIPHSLYEAASIDGASEWQIVKSIKLPELKGSLAITVIFSIIGSFQLFNEPSILQNMVPGNAITTYYTPNMYAYNLSFAGQPVELRRRPGDHDGRDHDGDRVRGAAQQHEGADEVAPWAVHHLHKTWIFQGA